MGEIGYVVVGIDGGLCCVCGKDGCLEVWFSVSCLCMVLVVEFEVCDEIFWDVGICMVIVVVLIVVVFDLFEVVLLGLVDLFDGIFIDVVIEIFYVCMFEGVFEDVSVCWMY